SAKRRRRRRRATAPTVEDRILGAWEEVLDRLAEAGLAVRRSMTLTEVGQAAAEHLSRPAVTPVVALIPDVRRTLYAPQIPGEATADQAWERVREFEGSLRAEQGRLRSLWGRL